MPCFQLWRDRHAIHPHAGAGAGDGLPVRCWRRRWVGVLLSLGLLLGPGVLQAERETRLPIAITGMQSLPGPPEALREGRPPACRAWLPTLLPGQQQTACRPVPTSSLANTMAILLALIVLIMIVYGVRHVVFTLNRLLGRQHHPYLHVETARWPTVTVFIAAHNEELVVAGCIEALLDIDYPAECLKIIPVNDRSTDRTREIIDDYVERHPGRIQPFHRTSGKPGKAAALKDAMAHAVGDIVIIFDADYVPGRNLLKQLTAPFFDPEVGAVMGRVVPINAGANLLTRMLDLERSGGYQVDQQARMNLRLVPQYGGTVGGVRQSAIAAIGGWSDDMLAEDTDMTYRLLINGWKTVYSNRSECYEEVPQEWSVRIRQVKRWAKGHNQVLGRYWLQLLRSPFISPRERLDGALLLLVFIMPPILLAGWVLAVGLYYLDSEPALSTFIPAFALMAYSSLGNFAAFFEIVSAVLLDGSRRRLRLLPINLLCFFVSLFAISESVASVIMDRMFKRELVWDKTIRYRAPAK